MHKKLIILKNEGEKAKKPRESVDIAFLLVGLCLSDVSK